MRSQISVTTRGRPATCAALLTIALVIAALPTTALAWGKEGHAIVALIARHYLNPKAAKAVDAITPDFTLYAESHNRLQRILQGAVAVVASTGWPDFVRKGPTEARVLSQHLQERPRAVVMATGI